MMATWTQGTGDELIAISKEGWARGVSILHFLGGGLIDLAGDRAVAQTKMTISQRGEVEGVLCDVLCTGRFYDFLERREGRWGTPGLLSYVGGTQTGEAWLEVLERMAADNPGPQRLGILTGPEISPITKNFETGLAKFLAAHPRISVAAKARTDYYPLCPAEGRGDGPGEP